MGAYKFLTKLQINKMNKQISKEEDKIKKKYKENEGPADVGKWRSPKDYIDDPNWPIDVYPEIEEFPLCCGAQVLDNFYDENGEIPKKVSKTTLLKLRLAIDRCLKNAVPLTFAILIEAQKKLYHRTLIDSGATLVKSVKGSHGYKLHSYMWNKAQTKIKKTKRIF